MRLGRIRGALFWAFLFTSIIVINFLQTLSLVILPFSSQSFRKINRFFADTWWGWCVLLCEKGVGITPEFSGDFIPDEENAIVFSNHQSMSDILVLMMLGKRKKRLGDMKWFVKDVLKYVPGIGWGMCFLDCLFVKRSWESDENYIREMFAKFISEKIPLWLVLFPEGTRRTPTKQSKAQEFARSRGWHAPSFVLVPRTKGFAASLHALRDYVQAVYDVSISYRGPAPSLWGFTRGEVQKVHVHVRRYPTSALPQDRAAIDPWLREQFKAKDTWVGQHDPPS